MVTCTDSSKDILRLLAKLAVFEGRGVTSNQNQIFQLMMATNKTLHDHFESMFIDITWKEEVCIINFPGHRQTFHECLTVKSEEEEQAGRKNVPEFQLDFLYVQLQFFNSMCLSRNYLWRQYVAQKFPFWKKVRPVLPFFSMDFISCFL